MKINSRNALEDWLTENFGFQDGYVAELFPPSTTDTPVTEVRLRLRYQIEGGYEAGTPITYKEYLIRANGVKLWTYTENTAFSPSHCVERVDTLDDKDGFLTIQLDVPEFVILKCEELLVEDPVIVKSIIERQINDNKIYAYAPNLNIPSPTDWVEWIVQEGLQVRWRYADGEAIKTSKVPYPDYTGWFLQEPVRISNTSFGVFFFELSKKPIYFFNVPNVTSDEGFFICLENKDSDNFNLWRAVTKIVAGWKGVQIRSENCKFTGEQWLSYLKDGSPPVKVNAISGEVTNVHDAGSNKRFYIRGRAIG